MASPARKTKTPPQAATPHHDIAIIGTGFSGLGMAIQLKKAGREDFVLLEKAGAIGGTWRDNHYPGAGCDVPSHLYSYSFEPNPHWSRAYSKQPEILSYLRHCVQKYELTPQLRLNSELLEMRWDEAQHRWQLGLADGSKLSARVVVSGVGGLSRPALPKVAGLDSFQGTSFHSAQWNHDYDLGGKRVAVIGTGASAIQFVPEIARKAGTLKLFQRTPPWLVPKMDGHISERAKTLFRLVPGAQRLVRSGIYWQNEAVALGFINPRLMGLLERLGRHHLRSQVKNPELRAKLTPDYTIGCKRILLSNNYYPTLCRDNVEVIAAGVQEVRAHSVIDTNGDEHAVDAIICGTGFEVQNPLGPLQVYDRDGRELRRRGGGGAYLGITMKKLPNAFFLLGPNTALGHTSVIFMIESQLNYVMKCLDAMDRKQAGSIEVKPEALDAYNRQIQSQLQRMVWSEGGCKSWYLNGKNENFAIWPGFTWRYWLKTRKPNLRHFVFGGKTAATLGKAA